MPRESVALELVQEGVACASVITPPDGSLDREARRIVEAVRDQFGVELPVVTGDRALKEIPTHAIALGCLADNPFVEALYRSTVDGERLSATVACSSFPPLPGSSPAAA